MQSSQKKTFAIRQSPYCGGISNIPYVYEAVFRYCSYLYAILFCPISLKADINFLRVAFSAFSIIHN